MNTTKHSNNIVNKYNNLREEDFINIANSAYKDYKSGLFSNSVLVNLSCTSNMFYDIDPETTKYKYMDIPNYFKIFICLK